jgi:hypothetical protein
MIAATAAAPSHFAVRLRAGVETLSNMSCLSWMNLLGSS